jgi:hypothetical protein
MSLGVKAIMDDRLVTRRQLTQLLMLSQQQLLALQLDQNIPHFRGKRKGYAICYRLGDVERYLNVKIPIASASQF